MRFDGVIMTIPLCATSSAKRAWRWCTVMRYHDNVSKQEEALVALCPLAGGDVTPAWLQDAARQVAGEELENSRSS